tara:strand:+ start:3218 stop:3523 length:306 start_codon:yes stop_codon:yes gene_type:complete
MAAIEFSLREILSRVRQAVPDANETYVLNLVNQCLSDMGKYATKMEYGKTNLVNDQLWYGLDDDRDITVNKVFRVSILNSDSEYIQIARLTNQEIKITDTE